MAAAEAGLDPAAVERVARRLTKQEPVSFLERVAGGPRRLRANIHLPVMMSEKLSTRLLSAIRAAAEVPGQGSADASGFAWHGWFQGNRLSATAHEDSEGSRVQVVVDRGAPMVNIFLMSQFLVVISIFIMIEEVNSIPEVFLLFAIPIGVLTAARAYWKSRTRAVREKIAALLDAVRESTPTAGDGGGGKEPQGQ